MQQLVRPEAILDIKIDMKIDRHSRKVLPPTMQPINPTPPNGITSSDNPFVVIHFGRPCGTCCPRTPSTSTCSQTPRTGASTTTIIAITTTSSTISSSNTASANRIASYYTTRQSY